MQTRLRLIFCLFLVAAAALGLARIVAAEAMDSSYRAERPCQSLLTSDGVFRWRDATGAACWLVQHDVGDV